MWTYGGRDEDKQGVSINAHGLQEGVASHLALSSAPPGQEGPGTQGHQPGVHEDHYCCYGYWKQETVDLTSGIRPLRSADAGLLVIPPKDQPVREHLSLFLVQ